MEEYYRTITKLFLQNLNKETVIEYQECYICLHDVYPYHEESGSHWWSMKTSMSDPTEIRPLWRTLQEIESDNN